jgi:hypothetical protein
MFIVVSLDMLEISWIPTLRNLGKKWISLRLDTVETQTLEFNNGLDVLVNCENQITSLAILFIILNGKFSFDWYLAGTKRCF